MLDLPRIASLWRNGSVVRSWLLDLAADALRDDPKLERVKDYVDDSGEGRWTVIESVERAIPAPVLTLALQARFRSRQPASFAGKLLAALGTSSAATPSRRRDARRRRARCGRAEPAARGERHAPRRGAVHVRGLRSSGDLTRRKLLLALLALHRDRLLDPRTAVLGFARRAMDDDEFRRETAAPRASTGSTTRRWARSRARSTTGRATSGARRTSASAHGPRSAGAGARHAGEPHLLPVAPPSAYPTLREPRPLGTRAPPERGVDARDRGEALQARSRVGARLNRLAHSWFDERQIYRIDHYLGKETVQNILVFRLAEQDLRAAPGTAATSITCRSPSPRRSALNRGRATTRAGGRPPGFPASKNHMLQLLALTAMEAISRFDADFVRDEKAGAPRRRPAPARGRWRAAPCAGSTPPDPWRAIRRLDTGRSRGWIRSQVETYLAVRLKMDNWQWAGVPFYLTWKRLAKRATEVAISFRRPPTSLFRALGCDPIEANVLRPADPARRGSPCRSERRLRHGRSRSSPCGWTSTT